MNHLGLLLTVLAISEGFSFKISDNEVATQWKSSVQEIIQQSSRLAEFADAAWNIHCNPLQPTHQHLLPSPHQKCDAPFPGLIPALPFHNIKGFRWTTQLESNWFQIKTELETYLECEEQKSWKTSFTKLCDNTSGFTKLTLQDDHGNPTDIGRKYFPNTLKLLQNYVGASLAPRPVNINCQAPSSGLSPHSDNMNFLLTCHLGLCIPKKADCVFRNGADEYHWEEGKLVIADTSFIHETYNTSPGESRYVLSFCIWHPVLSEEERHGIVMIHSLLQQFS
jgi:aspartyl/asparaginyl beta-hydroxylase (cupin superfamily)